MPNMYIFAVSVNILARQIVHDSPISPLPNFSRIVCTPCNLLAYLSDFSFFFLNWDSKGMIVYVNIRTYQDVHTYLPRCTYKAIHLYYIYVTTQVELYIYESHFLPQALKIA